MCQRAYVLALDAYAFAATLRVPAAWPLRDQILRALPWRRNIAEGAGRASDADFRRFLAHALGSLNEIEYDFLLARDLGLLDPAEHTRLTGLIGVVRRMLSGLMGQLKR